MFMNLKKFWGDFNGCKVNVLLCNVKFVVFLLLYDNIEWFEFIYVDNFVWCYIWGFFRIV